MLPKTGFREGVDEIPAFIFLFPVLSHPDTAMLQSGNKQFTQAALPIHLHLLATNHSQEQAALGVFLAAVGTQLFSLLKCQCFILWTAINGMLCLVLYLL